VLKERHQPLLLLPPHRPRPGPPALGRGAVARATWAVDYGEIAIYDGYNSLVPASASTAVVTMLFNDLLTKRAIEPDGVLVFRHRPKEPGLRKVLPWLAAEKPEVFNAYQSTQDEKVESALLRARYVASFIGHEAGKALFVGLYKVGASRPLTHEEFWNVPAFVEMKAYGIVGFTDNSRPSCLWFDLEPVEFYNEWKGKLVVRWPPPERSWWRWAHRNEIAVDAILADSVLHSAMPSWQTITLRWAELGIIPTKWREALSHWRGIYYIFDDSDGKGYVGAAYGPDNILGRWLNYAASGHGGNAQLRKRSPKNFSFSILERLSPDADATDVIALESTWKNRLHTRAPFGLNDN
jgi:hypothetical protein